MSPFHKQYEEALNIASQKFGDTEEVRLTCAAFVAERVKRALTGKEGEDGEAMFWLGEVRYHLKKDELPALIPDFLLNYVMGLDPSFIAECVNKCPEKDVVFGCYDLMRGMQIISKEKVHDPYSGPGSISV